MCTVTQSPSGDRSCNEKKSTPSEVVEYRSEDFASGLSLRVALATEVSENEETRQGAKSLPYITLR